MKLIRNSVFETNSSSCHSISVGNTDVYEGYSPDENGHIEIPIYEFGWNCDTYSGPEARLAYVYLYIQDWSGVMQETYREMFEKVVFAHTGATSISMESQQHKWGTETGYIDHQSVEDGQLNYLFESEKTLKNFLFDRGSFIETDNDNH